MSKYLCKSWKTCDKADICCCGEPHEMPTAIIGEVEGIILSTETSCPICLSGEYWEDHCVEMKTKKELQNVL